MRKNHVGGHGELGGDVDFRNRPQALRDEVGQQWWVRMVVAFKFERELARITRIHVYDVNGKAENVAVELKCRKSPHTARRTRREQNTTKERVGDHASNDGYVIGLGAKRKNSGSMQRAILKS